MKRLEHVDFLHAELQGSELPLLLNRSFVPTLREKVRLVLLATHSRKIEGVALRVLSKAGWELINERPVPFFHSDNLNPTSWTIVDGGHVWPNP